MNTQPPQSYYERSSERLLFRPIAADDIPRWLPFFGGNPSLKYLGMDSGEFKDLNDLEKSTKWLQLQIDRQLNGEYGQLAVVEKESGRFMGVGGLIFRDGFGVHEDYEVTYSLLTEFHGQGYGTELAIHFKQFAFEQLALDSVVSIIHKENVASINVAKKNGMAVDFELDDYMGMPVYIFRTHK